MGAVSTLSSVLLFSQASGDHCRALSSSSIYFFTNNRESKRRWATFGTLRLSYSSRVGGLGGRRAVVSNLRSEGSGVDSIEGGDGGFGGDDGSSNNNNNDNDSGDGDGESSKSGGMSMSQKLTLAYAALVGVGGVMGYAKSGSQKSLASGGLSALLLFYVFSELPSRPAFASSLGLGLSAALLAVMGSRFMKSRKLFPAGLVSFTSLIMAAGYLHGILRSLGA
ncbi:protein FATTY ACID EXPORT 2, chloroplastic-like [Magnolia sinica]|uniref:protein FATTY ACID EXPORT 2, chloroplastic-like n=1 Tax=Magnolia sinica TaxID=86752 RepID=UPI00265A594F|nr:protein FATTY ACID EXPORT 2, chloroplastic-like [Magnolia sinica]